MASDARRQIGREVGAERGEKTGFGGERSGSGRTRKAAEVVVHGIMVLVPFLSDLCSCNANGRNRAHRAKKVHTWSGKSILLNYSQLLVQDHYFSKTAMKKVSV